jgi:hypothetical protein
MKLTFRFALLAAAAVAASSANGQECPAWDKQVAELTPTQRDALAQQGAVFVPSKEFVISGSLVEPCGARLALGAYVDRVLRGVARETDRVEARRYSKDLKTVILRIWPSICGSKVLPKDGALRDEAYGILRGLTSGDLTEVLRPIIASGGLNIDVVHLVLEYRPTRLLPDLISYGSQTQIATQAIYAFGLVAALSPTQGLPKLRGIGRNRTLDAFQGKVVDGLIKKAEDRKRIVSDDLIDLEYEP